ncbi:MAG: hypothetical protein ABL866_16745 [Devosia sp.]
MSIDAEDDTIDRDYETEAELFAVQRQGRKRDLFYRRFDSAAEAMRFAVEEMPATASNLVLETEFGRFDAATIRRMYAADAFPLARRAPEAPQTTPA